MRITGKETSWPPSKPPPRLDNRFWFQERLHPFLALATVIIRAAQDLKPAIQSLHWLGFAECGKDLELVDMIFFKG